uniref:Refilin A n=2 Tax=Sus scrofa TaxID=9823 RepID=A0A8D0P8E1_PIG
MVGHLHLQGMEESLKEKSREGLLDSPDSGLPPSPSPSPPFYSQAPGILDARAGGAGASSEPTGPGEVRAPPALPPSALAREMRPRMLPVFFGESIEVNPEPTHEIRCNSEIKYASEKHFRDKVFYAPVPTVTAYSETIVAAPNCTWRSYRSQLTLEPRPRALHFRSTTIIFPKHASSSFRTTLHLSLGRPRRWFTASVQLQLCQCPGPSLLGPAAL